jgi:MtN3 and saliva related transmembrane protein
MIVDTQFLTDVVGGAAATCSVTSFIPQAVKIIRTRDASSVSLRMYVVTVIGFSLWITYGVLLRAWPLAGSNAVSLGLAGIILVLKLRYKSEAPSCVPPAG